jgi:hypothetical protein
MPIVSSVAASSSSFLPRKERCCFLASITLEYGLCGSHAVTEAIEPTRSRGQRRVDGVGCLKFDSCAEVRMACSILDLSWRTCACFLRGRRGGRVRCGSVQNPRETARPSARGVIATGRRSCGASSPPSTRRRGVRGCKQTPPMHSVAQGDLHLVHGSAGVFVGK